VEIITIQDPRLVAVANQQLGTRHTDENCRTIAALGAELLCVVIYSRFTPWHCEMSIASWHPAWCNRRFLRRAYTYPFVELGLRRIHVVTQESNTSTISLVQRLGHTREAQLRGWFGNEDGILYRMMREECKWL
jgi:RimJ/RimL family protein N-acetyltransferase